MILHNWVEWISQPETCKKNHLKLLWIAFNVHYSLKKLCKTVLNLSLKTEFTCNHFVVIMKPPLAIFFIPINILTINTTFQRIIENRIGVANKSATRRLEVNISRSSLNLVNKMIYLS